LFVTSLFLKVLFYLGSKILILISVFLSGGCFQQDLFVICIPIVLNDSWPGHARSAPVSIQLWLFDSPQSEHELVHTSVTDVACLMFLNVHLVPFFSILAAKGERHEV